MTDERSLSGRPPGDRKPTPPRPVSGEEQTGEQKVDHALRPRSLKEMIGQDQLRDKMQILVEAARKRTETLDHVLLYGPPGLGKCITAESVILTAAGLTPFHALLPDRGRLQLDLMTPADAPADFDATFPDDGRILLDELAPGAPASWRTLSGQASVRVDAEGRARVELADIVFTRARVAPNAVEQRSVASGLLVGEIVTEEWP